MVGWSGAVDLVLNHILPSSFAWKRFWTREHLVTFGKTGADLAHLPPALPSTGSIFISHMAAKAKTVVVTNTNLSTAQLASIDRMEVGPQCISARTISLGLPIVNDWSLHVEGHMTHSTPRRSADQDFVKQLRKLQQRLGNAQFRHYSVRIHAMHFTTDCLSLFLLPLGQCLLPPATTSRTISCYINADLSATQEMAPSSDVSRYPSGYVLPRT